jgi:hypothetical protein
MDGRMGEMNRGALISVLFAPSSFFLLLILPSFHSDSVLDSHSDSDSDSDPDPDSDSDSDFFTKEGFE